MRKVLATLACLSMAACAGSLDPSDPDPGPGDPGDPGDPVEPGVGNAQPQFQQSVLPIMRKCAGAGCHTGTLTFPPTFLGTGDEGEFYTTLTSPANVTYTGNFRPENATLLLKLAAGPHQGVTYTAEEEAAIAEWLQAEAAARNAGTPGDPGTPPPPPAVNLLAQWSGCMTQANWDAANMQAWANKGSNDGRCSGCHANGLARIFVNVNDTKMFLANQYEVFIYGFFTTAVDPVTQAVQVVPALDKLRIMGSGELGNLHPQYNVSPDDNAFQALAQFTQLTQQAVAAGQCAPPVFPTGPLPQ